MNITDLQSNAKKINDKKIKDINKILHLISERSYYKYDFEKYYINKLAMTLKPSQWIAFNKFEYDNNFNNHYTNAINKPAGFYCSKGEWFFHDLHIENETGIHNLHDNYINLIDIDYANIAVITNNHQAKKFLKKYIIVDKSVNSKHMNSCYVDWDFVKKDFYGFVLIPHFSYFPTNKNEEFNLASIKYGIALYGFDVSTLVFWDNRCVKNYKTLFNVSKYINEKNYTTYENKKNYTKLLINNIIIGLKQIIN